MLEPYDSHTAKFIDSWGYLALFVFAGAVMLLMTILRLPAVLAVSSETAIVVGVSVFSYGWAVASDEYPLLIGAGAGLMAVGVLGLRNRSGGA